MRLPYYIWIALRFLTTRLRQTVLTITGVALAVMIVAIAQSYMGGFLNFFIERSLESTPSVTVTQEQPGLPEPAGPVQRGLRALNNPVFEVSQLPVPPGEEELSNPRQAEETLARIPGVTAVAPFVTGQGLIVNGDLRQSVSFIGIRPREEARVTDIEARLIAGSIDALAEQANGIILGYLLADDVSAEIGSRLTIISAEGVSRRFQVVGIIATQIQDVDETRAYINLPQAQQLAGMRGISGLGLRTSSLDNAAPVARRIEATTEYRARSWREVNSGILDLFTTITLLIYLVVGLTMVVAGFGIANMLILTVNEKRRDIGVLKAVGMPAPAVAYLFLASSLVIGVIGVLIGELLGAGGIALLARTAIPIQAMESEGPAVVAEFFPMLRTARVYIVAGVFGLLVSVLFGILPSYRASRQDPIQVIRGAE